MSAQRRLELFDIVHVFLINHKPGEKFPSRIGNARAVQRPIFRRQIGRLIKFGERVRRRRGVNIYKPAVLAFHEPRGHSAHRAGGEKLVLTAGTAKRTSFHRHKLKLEPVLRHA